MKTEIPRRCAFTLVEIFIALAVVGILAAILFPAFERARASARTSTCVSNLRQIGQALGIYTSDHDGFYPPAITIKPSKSGVKAASIWWMNLRLQLPINCPEADLSFVPDKPKMKGLVGSYASNYRLTRNRGSQTKPKLSGKAEFVLRHPSLTVVAFDSRPFFDSMRIPDIARTVNELKDVLSTEKWEDKVLQLPPGATRHQGGANYLFGDGHVKWYRPEQLSVASRSDGVHPGFGL